MIQELKERIPAANFTPNDTNEIRKKSVVRVQEDFRKVI